MENNKSPLKFIIGGIIFIVLLVTLYNGITIIESTERGVKYTLGAVSDTLLTEGLYVTLPIVQKVRKVPITPTSFDVNIGVNEQGAITKDNQTIGLDLTVFYKYKEERIIDTAKNYGFTILKQKIEKDTMESAKQVIGQYTIFDLAVNQEKIRGEIMASVVSKVGDYPLLIDDLKVSNYDWSEEFEIQIAKTMQIAQENKQQEQELKKVEITAQQQVKQAEADKQARTLDAETARDVAKLNAEAKALEGDGIKRYNEAITANPKSMELQIRLKELEIALTRAQLWNGQEVPTQVWTSTPVGFTPLQQ